MVNMISTLGQLDSGNMKSTINIHFCMKNFPGNPIYQLDDVLIVIGASWSQIPCQGYMEANIKLTRSEATNVLHESFHDFHLYGLKFDQKARLPSSMYFDLSAVHIVGKQLRRKHNVICNVHPFEFISLVSEGWGLQWRFEIDTPSS